NVLDSVKPGTDCAFILPDKKLEKASKVFFASTFWKKLQSEIGNSCIAKMALFARMVSGARRRRINPVQTG
ncbi:MAG: hypothetical protein IIY88_00665, partial [Eubacterium sp.]|nr:hypothetical protein [Eubacterium sp.]